MASGSRHSSGSSSYWTAEQNKRFEMAAASLRRDPDFWHNVAKAVGDGKSVEEVKQHYEELVEDLERIEAGLMPIHPYYGKKGEGNSVTDKK